jgi:AcrR family transcriptional regulator
MFIQPFIANNQNSAPVAPTRRRGQGRDAILEVVRNLLRERSIDGLSMEMIAQHAGLTRRTIYNHFANTHELFTVSRERLINGLTPLVPIAISDRVPLMAGLTSFARQAIRLFADDRHHDLLLSVLRDGHTHRWLIAAYEETVQRPMQKALLTALTDAAAKGQFAGDPQRATFQFLWMLQASASPLLLDGGRNEVSPNTVSAVVAAFLAEHDRPAPARASLIAA